VEIIPNSQERALIVRKLVTKNCFSDKRDAANAALTGAPSPSPTSNPVNFGLSILETCHALALISKAKGNSDLWIADTGT
jgi:hypothetical protein